MNQQLASILRETGRSPEQLAQALNRRLAAQGQPTIHKTTPRHWVARGSRPRGKTLDFAVAILSEWTQKNLAPERLGWGNEIVISATSDCSAPWGASSVKQGLIAELGEDVDRRRYLAQSGMDLAALANPWLLDPIDQIADGASGRRVGVSTIGDIEIITAARRRMDDAVGGGTLLAVVQEDLKVTINLISRSSYSTEVGKALFSAAAEQARLASWLAFDTGQQGLAQHYTSLALKAAHTAEDRQVGANILGFAAVQAAVLGDGAAAEGFARTALAGGRGELTPAVESSLYGRLGLARARFGDVDGVTAAFERAEEILDRSGGEAEPDFMYWYTTADMHGGAGDAYLWASQPATAIPHLRRAAEDTPEAFTRDKAIWLSVEATAHVLSGDLEQGSDAAERALDIIGGDLESGRVVTLFEEFCASVEEVDRRAADTFRSRLADQISSQE